MTTPTVASAINRRRSPISCCRNNDEITVIWWYGAETQSRCNRNINHCQRIQHTEKVVQTMLKKTDNNNNNNKAARLEMKNTPLLKELQSRARCENNSSFKPQRTWSSIDGKVRFFHFQNKMHYANDTWKMLDWVCYIIQFGLDRTHFSTVFLFIWSWPGLLCWSFSARILPRSAGGSVQKYVQVRDTSDNVNSLPSQRCVLLILASLSPSGSEQARVNSAGLKQK